MLIIIMIISSSIASSTNSCITNNSMCVVSYSIIDLTMLLRLLLHGEVVYSYINIYILLPASAPKTRGIPSRLLLD